MTELDQILGAKPDHEENADNFLQSVAELKEKHPNIGIRAFKSESINPPEGFVDWLEERHPGIRKAITMAAAEKEEESLEKTKVLAHVEGNDETLVQDVFSAMEKLAYEYGGLENIEQREYLDRVKFTANLEGPQSVLAEFLGKTSPRFKISTWFNFK